MRARPLEGRRIVLTRQASKAGDSKAAIEALGGRAILLPAISIDRSGSFPDFEAALRDIPSYDYVIITSANTAQAMIEGLLTLGAPSRGPWVWVAIGRATARVLEDAGIEVGAMPEEAISDRIAKSLGELAGKRVLMPGSDIVRGTAAAEIRSLGAHVDEVVAYRTRAALVDPAALAELEGGVDAIVFTSPSTVRGFDEMTKGRFRSDDTGLVRADNTGLVRADNTGLVRADNTGLVRADNTGLVRADNTGLVRDGGPSTQREGETLVACIGPVTAAEAMTMGYRVDIVSADHSMDGLVESLVDYWRDAQTRAAKGAIA